MAINRHGQESGNLHATRLENSQHDTGEGKADVRSFANGLANGFPGDTCADNRLRYIPCTNEAIGE